MLVVAVRIACALLVVTLPAGCGDEVVRLHELGGDKVAAMAERELEAENPGLAAGSLTCPDLRFRVGASVRCLRTTTLPNGRIVKVGGTVRVSSLASGGRLHVAMDSKASEFGLSGAQVASELRRQYPHLFRGEPGAVDCPYLRGELNATVACHVRVGGDRRTVDAVVAQVDPAAYSVRCRFRPHQPAPTPAD
jgi:hypothetical protein